MQVAAKIFVSVLIVGMPAAVYAQSNGNSNANQNDSANPTLTQNPTVPPAAIGNFSQQGSTGVTGLSKGSDGVISSMRANGTRTTESAISRPPNRTGTMPGTR